MCRFIVVRFCSPLYYCVLHVFLYFEKLTNKKISCFKHAMTSILAFLQCWKLRRSSSFLFQFSTKGSKFSVGSHQYLQIIILLILSCIAEYESNMQIWKENFALRKFDLCKFSFLLWFRNMNLLKKERRKQFNWFSIANLVSSVSLRLKCIFNEVRWR